MLATFLDWIGWERVSETNKRHKEIMSKLSELAGALTGIDAKLTEASTEITGLIKDLRDALDNTEIPAEAQAALDAITAKAAALADIVPNT